MRVPFQTGQSLRSQDQVELGGRHVIELMLQPDTVFFGKHVDPFLDIVVTVRLEVVPERSHRRIAILRYLVKGCSSKYLGDRASRTGFGPDKFAPTAGGGAIALR